MAGRRGLRRLQFGKETTAGTIAAATALWRGKGTLVDNLVEIFTEEDIGYLSGVDRTYIPQLGGAVALEDTPATFEQVLYLLEAGVKTVWTGSTDTGGSGKVYTYTFPTTTINTIQSLTVEGGDDAGAEVMEYGFVPDFSLKGEAGQAVMMSGNIVGRQVVPQAFTTQPGTPTVEEVIFLKGKLYIDTAGGTMGTTQKSNTFVAMALAVKTGWIPKFTADGNLYFAFPQHTKENMEILLDITFEHDATSLAEKVAWRAQTPRQIRVEFAGTTLTTAGSSHATKKLRVDMAGKWERFEKIDERNGNDVVTGKFRARYEATSTKFAEIVAVNQLANLP